MLGCCGEVTAGLVESTTGFMADGFGHLRADCRGPGSAPEPRAGFEYGTTTIDVKKHSA